MTKKDLEAELNRLAGINSKLEKELDEANRERKNVTSALHETHNMNRRFLAIIEDLSKPRKI